MGHTQAVWTRRDTLGETKVRELRAVGGPRFKKRVKHVRFLADARRTKEQAEDPAEDQEEHEPRTLFR